MFQLMAERRLFIAPSCKWTIEALEKCPLGAARYGGKKPYGKYAHVTDALGYPVWRLEPKARARVTIKPGDIGTVEIPRYDPFAPASIETRRRWI
jgi:hypothetical protein